MPELVEVGQGESRTGERWWLSVGWAPHGDFYTIVQIEQPPNLRAGGGPGGAALAAGETARVSTGLVGSDLLYVVGRVDPAIRRVHVELDDPAETDIELVPLGDAATYGMRFVATVLPRGVGLTKVLAVDMDGGEFEVTTRFRTPRDFEATQRHQY